MTLTDQEKGMGIKVVKCLCCGNVYKAFGHQIACVYNMIPNYGCGQCQGIPPIKQSEHHKEKTEG